VASIASDRFCASPPSPLKVMNNIDALVDKIVDRVRQKGLISSNFVQKKASYDMLNENSMEKIKDAHELAKFIDHTLLKPDATRTIIFPDTLRLAPGGTEKPVSGFYNIGLVETDADTFPLITNCKAGGKDVSAADSTYCTAGTKNEANCLPKVSGSVGVVPRAKGVGFKVIITDQDKLSSGTTYICDFVITSAIKSAETTGPNYYDKMQFFLEIGK